MPPTIQSVAASMTRETAETVIFVALATPPDKHHWKPLDNGRSIVAQVVECALANRKWTEILQRREWFTYTEAVVEESLTEWDTLEKATAHLRTAANALALAIESVPDRDMSGSIETPWGPYPLPRCCLHAYWNMVYHEGQINYVQTLYGDFEEHEPE
jgi:hypothetical protein